MRSLKYYIREQQEMDYSKLDKITVKGEVIHTKGSKDVDTNDKKGEDSKEVSESLGKQYHVYHGTNKDFDKFTLDNSASSQGEAGWFIDDYSYASTQGKYVKEFILKPNKILSKETIMGLNDDEIVNALMKYNTRVPEKRIIKLLPKVKRNFEKYYKGDIGGHDIFNGFGDTNILRNLGFDMEVLPNPYDKSKQTNFYIVFNDMIVHNK